MNLIASKTLKLFYKAEKDHNNPVDIKEVLKNKVSILIVQKGKFKKEYVQLVRALSYRRQSAIIDLALF